MNINTVKQWTRYSFLIFRNDSRCTRTGFLWVEKPATWTGLTSFSRSMKDRIFILKDGEIIEEGNFKYSTAVNHTHEGSIGNLQNDKIVLMMDNVIKKFDFEKVKTALQKLLQ